MGLARLPEIRSGEYLPIGRILDREIISRSGTIDIYICGGKLERIVKRQLHIYNSFIHHPALHIHSGLHIINGQPLHVSLSARTH